MSLQVGPRRGRVWDDIKFLDELIKTTRFAMTGKNEREFELAFMSVLNAHTGRISSKIHSQMDKDTVVKSVYAFGKKHRPDLTLNEDGVAIEVKFLKSSTDGIKQAIGQSIFYRVRYRFVVNLIVVGEDKKDAYLRAANGEERDLEEILSDMSSEFNVFTYVVPAFNPGLNVKAVLSWNDIQPAETPETSSSAA